MMKVLLVLGAALLAGRALGAALHEAEDGPSQDDRSKRTADLIGYIGSKVKSKISSFAHASAGLSSSSGKHHDSPPVEYGPPLEYEHKTFDIWGFKKSIFNTLFQAVKAIKGGILAIKGQLIKAKGHILATKGRILSAKGEAITDFGRHVASKALLSPQYATSASAHSAEASAPGGFDGYGWTSGAGGPPSWVGTGDDWSAPSGAGYLPPIHSSSGSYSGYSSSGSHSGHSSGSHSGHSSSGSYFSGQSGYGPPSASYGFPSGSYKVARAASASHDHKHSDEDHSGLSGVQAGLLLLKPISVPEKSVSSHFGSHSEPVASYVGTPRDAAVDVQKSLSYLPSAGIFGF